MTAGHDDDERPRRGRRPLREDERTLWKEVTRSMKPLRKPRPVPAPLVAGSTPNLEAKKVPPPPPGKQPKRVKSVAPIPTPVVVAPVATKPPPPLAPLGRRERSRVARGVTVIDARIDLHGMWQNEAHAALSRFLQHHQGRGAKLVLVITGKGARFYGEDDRERGVLKRHVPMWLREMHDIVIGFEDAGIGHGGTGALYVRLRARR